MTVPVGTPMDDMMRYHVKDDVDEATLFTREGTELEAYRSTVGKLPLSNPPNEQLELYRLRGPFGRLTRKAYGRPPAQRGAGRGPARAARLGPGGGGGADLRNHRHA